MGNPAFLLKMEVTIPFARPPMGTAIRAGFWQRPLLSVEFCRTESELKGVGVGRGWDASWEKLPEVHGRGLHIGVRGTMARKRESGRAVVSGIWLKVGKGGTGSWRWGGVLKGSQPVPAPSPGPLPPTPRLIPPPRGGELMLPSMPRC